VSPVSEDERYTSLVTVGLYFINRLQRGELVVRRTPRTYEQSYDRFLVKIVKRDFTIARCDDLYFSSSDADSTL